MHKKRHLPKMARGRCVNARIFHFQVFFIGRGTAKNTLLFQSGGALRKKVSAAFFARNCFYVCETENIVSRRRALGAKLVRPFYPGPPLLRGWKAQTAGVVFVTLMEACCASCIRIRGGKTSLVPRHSRRHGIYAPFFRSPSRSEFKRIVLRVLSKNGSKSFFSSWMFFTLCTVCKQGKLFWGV